MAEKNKIWHKFNAEDKDKTPFLTLCGKDWKSVPISVDWSDVNCEECLQYKNKK